VKILFVGASGDRYGADAVLLNIAAHMQANGEECVLVLAEDGPGREAASTQGLRVELLRMPVLRRADLNVLGLIKLVSLLALGSLSHLRVLRRERPDLVWVNTITIPLWIVAARLLRRRVVCHSHELVGGSRWLRRLMYLPLVLTNKVILISDACRRDVLDVYPRLEQRMVMVVNPSFAVRERLPVRRGSETAIVVIGRISARKGQDVLMEALEDPRLAELRPVVHVCGDAYRSPAAQAYVSKVREHAAALDADVRFHGYVPASEALAMGGIVVVPSVAPEPCGLVVAEAIAAGRAVVASDCGGIPEVAGGAALLVPARHPGALAEALTRIVGDPAEREKLERASLRRAGDLSSDTYLARIDDLVRDLVVEVAQ